METHRTEWERRSASPEAAPEVYRHMQIAWPIIIPVDVAAAFCLYVGITRSETAAVITFAALMVAVSQFFALTVVGTADRLSLRFGPGPIRKTFNLKDIVAASPHRTSFWNGWGIRYSREGIIYNVSGFRAVKITLRNGRKYIIGSDEPDRLLAFIEEHRSR